MLDTRKFIDQLIEKKIARYKEDYNEMLGDYNRELETINGYNGRQILELLQNCDDEGASDILIEIDTNQKIISISNNGTPFSEKGYRSLFIANLSSKKSKKQYIGNKGLGFRSIINWSNQIEIRSNGLSLVYSEENRRDHFLQLFDPEIQTKIRAEEDLRESVIPIPFLCIPLVKDENLEEYTTSIIIDYKDEYYDDIIKQVEKLTPETLLFIKNIKSIKFKGFSNCTEIQCKRQTIEQGQLIFSPFQKISLNGDNWNVFQEESDLPSEYINSDKNETEFYQIRIAVEENFKKSSSYLYSFFPTNIELKQPYILHATFDLDATRNQINDSKKNRYILEKVVEFTIKIAKYFVGSNVDYRPLEILNHSHKSDTLNKLGYYSLVNSAIETEEIFPCIDNQYRCLADIIYISDVFANMLTSINAVQFISIHIKPLEDRKLTDFNFYSKIDKTLSVLDNVVNIINQIAAKKLNHSQRAMFISQIVFECGFIKSEYPNQINFLINDENDIILGEEYIYTPVTQSNKLKIPTFATIQFINQDLFIKLLYSFKYRESASSNKSRFIYDQLSGFCNIHSYEPATLAQKIISETNSTLKKNPDNSISVISEMNSCLFYNYKLLDSETKKSPLRQSAPILTQNKQIRQSNEVVLSGKFPSGERVAAIFKGIYSDQNYMADPYILGIEHNEDIYEIENYFIWINVNRFVKYETKETKSNSHEYPVYVRRFIGNFDSTSCDVTYISINNFETILAHISLNQLIVWIYFDEILKRQIDNRRNADVYKNFFRSSYIIPNKPSYIKYLLSTKYKIKFDELLLDDKYGWINQFNIDYQAAEFIENEIPRSSIKEILIQLGAKDDFNNISIDKVSSILKKLPEQYPDGKKSQSFYKRALSHYKKNSKDLIGVVPLFADDGSGLKLYKPNEIYFSDRIKLPKRLKANFPVFNFPSRAGGVEAIKFFRVNDLNNIEILVTNFSQIDDLTSEFRSYLERVKPLILTYRINAMEDRSQQKVQAAICNKIDIILCDEINYKVKGDLFQVNEHEFLHHGENQYLVKINRYDSIKKLRKTGGFIDCIADVISLSFDVSGEKSEFKSILRSEFNDAAKAIKEDFGDDVLQEAKELLGLTNYRNAFWEAVFIAKGLPFIDSEDDLGLEQLIKDKFHINFEISSIDYDNLNTESELIKIRTLFSDIQLTVSDFIAEYAYNLSFAAIHFKMIKNAILGSKNQTKTSVWESLKNRDIEVKANFINSLSKVENCEEFALKSADEFSSVPEIDISSIVSSFIKLTYGDIKTFSEIDLEKIKLDNLTLFSKEDRYLISENIRFKSLIYFSDALIVIRQEIQKLKKIQEKESDVKADEKIEKPSLVSSENLVPKPIINQVTRKRKPYTPKVADPRILKEKGNTSEQIVYKYLNENKYKEVYLASADDEGLHYDIRYTSESGVVKYVEVKTFDNGYFHLSSDQYDFGLENKDNFEIWLVQHTNKIIPIRDFFSNSKYQPDISEYKIFLDLLEENK